MLIAGILGHEGKSKTAHLINSILSLTGKRVSIIDLKNFSDCDSRLLRDYITELEKNSVDTLILKMELADVEKNIFDNLRFDVMIYVDKGSKIFPSLNENGIAIVNIDDHELIQFLQGMKYYTVTYGFNSKASITTSSTGDIVNKDNFMCCLQRSISARNGKIIEPQEYRINMETNGLNEYNLLAAATFAIINGVDLNALDYNTPKLN